MQIKCLTWLLEAEKKIGASDPESDFLNILPLEIRILERKSELGEDLKVQLSRLREALKKKDTNAVPKTLLPTKAEQALPSDGHKPSSRDPSDGPSAPADAN